MKLKKQWYILILLILIAIFLIFLFEKGELIGASIAK